MTNQPTSTSSTEVCGEECYTHNRREFGALILGAGLTVVGAKAMAAGLPVTETDVTIKTPDGDCDAVFTHPSTGSYPGVLVWADAGGLRPAFRDMGKRLAAEGYAVLTPNPFYRYIKAPVPADLKPEDRPKLREGLIAAGGAERDAAAFIAFLKAQSAVKNSSKMGTTGYCMGGALTMRTAATQSDVIGAAGSFHGGGLVTDQPTSPHLLVPQIKARYIICVAENDDVRQPEAKDKLREAFAAVKNPADVEVFKANHGWCVPGGQVYNEAEAERAWAKLLALFKATLA